MTISQLHVRRTVLVLVAVAAVAMTPGLPAALRTAGVLPFFLLAPGLAWAFALPLSRLGERLTVAVAVSLAADVLVAEVLLYAGVLQTVPLFAGLTVIALGGVVVLGPAVDRQRSPVSPDLGGPR